MLGVNSKRTLISGKFAEDIRKRMSGIQSKRLNRDDLNEIIKNRQRYTESKYSLIWK